MSGFEVLLQNIAKRPGMYVGKCSIRAVSHYLDGYSHALVDVGHTETPLDGWMRWIESRFLISDPAWHWTRILLHVYGSDQAAIEALPLLHKEFLARRAAIGVRGIEDEQERRLIAKHGTVCYRPSDTSTILDD
jgi:hypothetical protein